MILERQMQFQKLVIQSIRTYAALDYVSRASVLVVRLTRAQQVQRLVYNCTVYPCLPSEYRAYNIHFHCGYNWIQIHSVYSSSKENSSYWDACYQSFGQSRLDRVRRMPPSNDTDYGAWSEISFTVALHRLPLIRGKLSKFCVGWWEYLKRPQWAALFVELLHHVFFIASQDATRRYRLSSTCRPSFERPCWSGLIQETYCICKT